MREERETGSAQPLLTCRYVSNLEAPMGTGHAKECGAVAHSFPVLGLKCPGLKAKNDKQKCSSLLLTLVFFCSVSPAKAPTLSYFHTWNIPQCRGLCGIALEETHGAHPVPSASSPRTACQSLGCKSKDLQGPGRQQRERSGASEPGKGAPSRSVTQSWLLSPVLSSGCTSFLG